MLTHTLKPAEKTPAVSGIKVEQITGPLYLGLAEYICIRTEQVTSSGVFPQKEWGGRETEVRKTTTIQTETTERGREVPALARSLGIHYRALDCYRHLTHILFSILLPGLSGDTVL